MPPASTAYNKSTKTFTTYANSGMEESAGRYQPRTVGCAFLLRIRSLEMSGETRRATVTPRARCP